MIHEKVLRKFWKKFQNTFVKISCNFQENVKKTSEKLQEKCDVILRKFLSNFDEFSM